MGTALARGQAALDEGRWTEARQAFEEALAADESPEAQFGLAGALWWLGENGPSVAACTKAYALFRRRGDVVGAVQAAVWLCITYKANFANFPAANGWISRADDLLRGSDPGPLHAYAWLGRAYQHPDPVEAATLSQRALELARAAGDVDLELVALSQLGRIRVETGDADAGFDLIDGAMAAALAGEGSHLDTVVFTCCDMLNACEHAADLERAAQWCRVADDFIERYGCPFLYAECRTLYGGVLLARGRWTDAGRELAAALALTAGSCPALHARALARLVQLRIREGRLEDAERLIADAHAELESHAEVALSRAALLLARGDAAAATSVLSTRVRNLDERRLDGALALALVVDAHLAASDVDAAEIAAGRLTALAASSGVERIGAEAASAKGRVALARGAGPDAVADLEEAVATWTRLELPFEAAVAASVLAVALAPDRPDVAIEHARAALASFERLGAAAEADRVAAFLRALGVVPRVGPKGAGAGTLTSREQEVLHLLGLGLTNPEIAARLHVSRKTASHHVSSILSKLHLRNGSEAAAHAVSGGRSPN